MLAEGLTVAAQLDHVDAGLEGGTLAGVDDHPHGRIAIELEPRRLQLVEHAGVHGVSGLGAVEHEPADRTPSLDLQLLVAVGAHQLRGMSDQGASRHGSGSRGSPSTRSPTTFLFTSVVPPSMVLARLRSMPCTSNGSDSS